MSFLDMVLVTSKQIGNITITVSIEETAIDELEVTEHPVARGAPITDHAFRRPAELIMQCGWSNSDLRALLANTQVQFAGGAANADYVSGVYSQLLALQQSRKPFDVVTTRRVYNNMLLTGLTTVTDAKTFAVLIVKATLREVIIVDTAETTLPPSENQVSPEKTAEMQNAGTKAAIPGNPVPGGAVPSTQWGSP
ncbi:hypothetical protein BKK79_35745 [Cupriavidus sp. USMAA2-4]|uniref:phage baseplate protein n=1 Tax=Cupriavidus sp. USMAA2-4 TaxID=876364 RepID=UPI0008A67EDE|nr:hypothetical protein [Cupriavidus sp. USMAA2-4]AOY96849.1 hypothetical protein BKK79_35745 [Cupriavidus sp. USMAA2-4]